MISSTQYRLALPGSALTYLRMLIVGIWRVTDMRKISLGEIMLMVGLAGLCTLSLWWVIRPACEFERKWVPVITAEDLRTCAPAHSQWTCYERLGYKRYNTCTGGE